MFKCLHAKKCSAATSNLEKLFIGAQPDTHVECVFVIENDVVFGCSDRLEKFPFAQLNEFVKTLDGIEGDGRFVVYSDGPRQGDFDCTFEIDLGPDFNERRRVFKDMGGETSLYIKDKEKYIKENEDEEFHKFIGSMVKCEHCKSVFKFNSYKVSSGIFHNVVRCANYPDCRGSIEDFAITRAKKEKTNTEVVKIRDIRMEHEALQGNPIVAEYKVHAKSGITTLVSRSEKQLTFFIIKKEMYNSLRPQIRVLFASAVRNFDLTVISSYMALCPVLAVRLTHP